MSIEIITRVICNKCKIASVEVSGRAARILDAITEANTNNWDVLSVTSDGETSLHFCPECVKNPANASSPFPQGTKIVVIHPTEEHDYLMGTAGMVEFVNPDSTLEISLSDWSGIRTFTSDEVIKDDGVD